LASGPLQADWPIVGRDEELEFLRADRSTTPASSAIITGPPGVGKSRLAGAAATEAANEGWATLAIRASAGLGEIPLGPLRTVLHIPSSGDLAQLAQSVEEALVSMRSAKGLLVLVNDGHHLDESSAGLLHQLVAAGSILALVTARSNAPLPTALTDLWRDGLAQRTELQNLSRRETAELLTAVLGDLLQDSSANRIWQMTGGNPLYVREVVLAGIETGALRRSNEEWRWRGQWAKGTRLQEIVADRIGRLDPDASTAMEMVALAGSLPLALVTRLTTTGALEQLEQRTLVTVERAGNRLEVTIAHPLHAEVLRNQMPTLRRRAMWRNLVEALRTTGTRRTADHVRLACWSIEAGLEADPMTLALGTDASLHGVGHALSARLNEIFPESIPVVPVGEAPAVRQDHHLALRLAETAYERSGSVPDGVALARTLAWMGAVERAESVLGDLAGEIEAPDDRVRLALAVAWVRFWGGHDVDGAESVLQEVTGVDEPGCGPVLRAQAYQQLATIALNTARPDLALALARQAAAVEGIPLRASPAASTAAGSLSYLGRCGEAIALADEAVPEARDRGNRLTMATLLFVKAGALARSGRLEEGRELAEWLREVSLSNELLDAAATFGVLLGEILLRQGRPATASRIFRDSSGLLAERDLLGYRPWALSGLVRARALVRDEHAAAAAAELGRLPIFSPRHYDASRYLAEIELHVLQGRSAQALDIARHGVAWARSCGMVIDEAWMLDAWMQISPSPTVADRLGELAGSTDSELVKSLADRARALVAGDPEALLAASRRLADTTAWWLAAEAASHAAHILERRGEAKPSTAAARLAAELAARGEGARNLADSLGGPARLTQREREIASLASAGHSSQAIAERLSLSRRTVESHLHHIYVKLGISDRAQLAAAIGSDPPRSQ
jgi:DNA-binding NarL/FixJ family response regulator